MDPSVFIFIFPLWFKAFVFTLAAEIPVFVLVARTGEKRQPRTRIMRLALAGGAGTLVTHPLLWFIWPFVVREYTSYIVSGELIVVLVESVIFFLVARSVTFPRALAASFLANGFSFGLGALI